MKNFLLTGLALFLTCCSFAQGDPEIKLYLRNGDIMTGTAKLSTISLITDYGKLSIPLRSVSTISIGITPAKALESKISNLIQQTLNSDENMRKAAYEELGNLPIGAIPVLSDLVYSGKFETGKFTDYTPEGALQDLMNRHSVPDGFSSKDVVTIDYMYTMGGTFEFSKIELKTPHSSSPQNISKEQIKEIEVLSIPGDANEKGFVLLASKHISSNTNGGWMKTGIMLKSGQKFSVSATGEVTLASLSGNKYKPDGSVTVVSGGGGEEGIDDGGGANKNSTYPIYGNVVYKIGDSGTVMKAGARFSGNANAGGMLYISIYETVYSDKNTGTYAVKVALK